MSFKDDLKKQFPGLEITDTNMEGEWGPLYLVKFKDASNVIAEESIEEWCIDTIRSENWIYNKQK